MGMRRHTFFSVNDFIFEILPIICVASVVLIALSMIVAFFYLEGFPKTYIVHYIHRGKVIHTVNVWAFGESHAIKRATSLIEPSILEKDTLFRVVNR